METLTHWKKQFNYNYLGSHSIPIEGDLVLTIARTGKEKVKNETGKEEECFILYFKEQGYKPMILNKTNAKVITKIHGTPFVEEWVGKQVSIYTKKVDAWGTQTDALRIRDFKPVVKQVDVSEVISRLKESKSVVELESAYKSLPREEMYNKEVIKFVNELKTTLQ